MKKILLLLFLTASLFASAQPKVNGRGEANTPVDARLMVSKNLFIPTYQDTTAANLDLGIDSSAGFIWTRSPMSLWVREYTVHGVKKWTLYGTGATPPAGSNRAIQWNDAGTMGASDAFKYTTSGYLDLSYGGLAFLVGADNSATTRTNATGKSAIFAFPHYSTSEENVMFALMQSFSGSNTLQVGYGNASYNSVTEIRLGVGATATSTLGVEKVRITNTGAYFGTGANPSAKIHIEAGSTTIAPLRFTSGTNKTTAAAGEMEYDGTNLYFTPTGTTRKRLAITNNATPSNGQIPIGNGTDYTAANITSTGSSITVTNGAGTINLETAVAMSAGTYTPTLTGTANVEDLTAYVLSYYRVGNNVTVFGRLEIDPTTSSTTTALRLSLPIASNFANNGDGVGMGTENVTGPVWNIIADSANDEMIINGTPSYDAKTFVYINFSYKII